MLSATAISKDKVIVKFTDPHATEDLTRFKADIASSRHCSLIGNDTWLLLHADLYTHIQWVQEALESLQFQGTLWPEPSIAQR